MDKNQKIYYTINGDDLSVKTVEEFVRIYASQLLISESEGKIIEDCSHLDADGSIVNSYALFCLTEYNSAIWEIAFSIAVKKVDLIYRDFAWDISASRLASKTNSINLLRELVKYGDK